MYVSWPACVQSLTAAVVVLTVSCPAAAHHTLAECRELIATELDAPPTHYLFEYKGAPVARKQEARRRAVKAHPSQSKLVLLPQPHVASPPCTVAVTSPAEPSPTKKQRVHA